KAAHESGARWVVLCDTNGGTLPHEVEQIVREVVKHVPGDHVGIHAHNDTEQAVANSLAAVRAGVRQIQGTLNGLGERCGNANLVGNERKILVSDQAGRSNVLSELERIGLAVDRNDARVTRLLDEVKERETAGFAYEAADASFELLARRVLGRVPDYFAVEKF